MRGLLSAPSLRKEEKKRHERERGEEGEKTLA